jgi:plasmid maintenance system antidote protein VapI
MTPADLAATLDALGWSSRHLARQLGCAQNTPQNWLSGRAAVPPQVASWLRALAVAHARHPAPQDWRTRSAA